MGGDGRGSSSPQRRFPLWVQRRLAGGDTRASPGMAGYRELNEPSRTADCESAAEPGAAYRTESCSRSIIVCSSSPVRRSAASRSPITTSTRTLTHRSAGPAPAARAAAGPLGIQRPSRRLPHRLTTRPTPDDAHPATRPRHIHVVGGHFDHRDPFHVPPPISDDSCTTHLVHGRKVPPGRVTAEAGEIAFPGCDHEPAQAHRRVGL
jgi:hypothetical protein